MGTTQGRAKAKAKAKLSESAKMVTCAQGEGINFNIKPTECNWMYNKINMNHVGLEQSPEDRQFDQLIRLLGVLPGLINGVFSLYTAKDIIENKIIESKLGVNIHPLMFLSAMGHKEGVLALLDAGVDPNIWQTKVASTTKSIFKMKTDSVDETLALIPFDGNRPLHMAVISSQLAIIDILLSRGADIKLLNKDGLSPAHLAVKQGRDIVLKRIVLHPANVDLNHCDKDGMSVLHHVVQKRVLHPDTVEVLLKAERLHKDACGCNGLTPLTYAAMNGMRTMSLQLVNHKAQILALNNNSTTAICMSSASSDGRVALSLLLLLSDKDMKLYCELLVNKMKNPLRDGKINMKHLVDYVLLPICYVYTFTSGRTFLVEQNFVSLWLGALVGCKMDSMEFSKAIQLLYQFLIKEQKDNVLLKLIGSKKCLSVILQIIENCKLEEENVNVSSLLLFIVIPAVRDPNVNEWILKYFDKLDRFFWLLRLGLFNELLQICQLTEESLKANWEYFKNTYDAKLLEVSDDRLNDLQKLEGARYFQKEYRFDKINMRHGNLDQCFGLNMGQNTTKTSGFNSRIELEGNKSTVDIHAVNNPYSFLQKTGTPGTPVMNNSSNMSPPDVVPLSSILATAKKEKQKYAKKVPSPKNENSISITNQQFSKPETSLSLIGKRPILKPTKVSGFAVKSSEMIKPQILKDVNINNIAQTNIQAKNPKVKKEKNLFNTFDWMFQNQDKVKLKKELPKLNAISVTESQENIFKPNSNSKKPEVLVTYRSAGSKEDKDLVEVKCASEYNIKEEQKLISTEKSIQQSQTEPIKDDFISSSKSDSKLTYHTTTTKFLSEKPSSLRKDKSAETGSKSNLAFYLDWSETVPPADLSCRVSATDCARLEAIFERNAKMLINMNDICKDETFRKKAKALLMGDTGRKTSTPKEETTITDSTDNGLVSSNLALYLQWAQNRKEPNVPNTTYHFGSSDKSPINNAKKENSESHSSIELSRTNSIRHKFINCQTVGNNSQIMRKKKTTIQPNNKVADKLNPLLKHSDDYYSSILLNYLDKDKTKNEHETKSDGHRKDSELHNSVRLLFDFKSNCRPDGQDLLCDNQPTLESGSDSDSLCDYCFRDEFVCVGDTAELPSSSSNEDDDQRIEMAEKTCRRCKCSHPLGKSNESKKILEKSHRKEVEEKAAPKAKSITCPLPYPSDEIKPQNSYRLGGCLDDVKSVVGHNSERQHRDKTNFKDKIQVQVLNIAEHTTSLKDAWEKMAKLGQEEVLRLYIPNSNEEEFATLTPDTSWFDEMKCVRTTNWDPIDAGTDDNSSALVTNSNKTIQCQSSTNEDVAPDHQKGENKSYASGDPCQESSPKQQGHGDGQPNCKGAASEKAGSDLNLNPSAQAVCHVDSPSPIPYSPTDKPFKFSDMSWNDEYREYGLIAVKGFGVQSPLKIKLQQLEDSTNYFHPMLTGTDDKPKEDRERNPFTLNFRKLRVPEESETVEIKWTPYSLRRQGTFHALRGIPNSMRRWTADFVTARTGDAFVMKQNDEGTTSIGLHHDGTEIIIKEWNEKYLPDVKDALLTLPSDLSHEHILLPKVQYFEDVTGYVCYPLCEYSLADYVSVHLMVLKDSNQLQQHLVLQIFEGLDYLHSRDIIHGRLKPWNVLIDMSAKVRLADYGLPLSNDADDIWRATESITKHEPTQPGQKGDIQVVGMLMHYMVTGQHPLGNNRQEVVAAAKAGCTKYSRIDNTCFLITAVMVFDPRLRPSAEECLNHIWFWSAEKKLSFMREVSKELDRSGSCGKSVDLELAYEINCITLYYNNVKVPGKEISDWRKLVDYSVRRSIESLRGGERFESSITELLRFMDHLYVCKNILPPKQKAIVGNVSEYFSTLFWRLPYELYIGLGDLMVADRLSLNGYFIAPVAAMCGCPYKPCIKLP